MGISKGARATAFHGEALVHGVANIDGLLVNSKLAKEHSVFVLQLVGDRVPDVGRSEA